MQATKSGHFQKGQTPQQNQYPTLVTYGIHLPVANNKHKHQVRFVHALERELNKEKRILKI